MGVDLGELWFTARLREKVSETISKNKYSMVVRACNPAIQKAQVGGSPSEVSPGIKYYLG
jgi:hypothetical protein